MSRCSVRRKAADSSLVPLAAATALTAPTIRWCTSERGDVRGPGPRRGRRRLAPHRGRRRGRRVAARAGRRAHRLRQDQAPERRPGSSPPRPPGCAGWRPPRRYRSPTVLAVAEGPDDDPPVLVLPWIQPHRHGHRDEEALGRGLAMLHRAGAPSYGFNGPGFIGPLPLDNRTSATWAEFWWARRIEPFLRLAVDAGALDADGAAEISDLEEQVAELLGPPEPIARLHGDLWTGNVLWSEDGRPWLIDPSAYGGRREVDLAMLGLFGGISEPAFGAYDEAWPLAEGYEDRVPLYQLYPLLVHTVLFDGGTPSGRWRRRGTTSRSRRARRPPRSPSRRPLHLRMTSPSCSARWPSAAAPRPTGSCSVPTSRTSATTTAASPIATSPTTGAGRPGAAGRWSWRRPASIRRTGRTSAARWPSVAPTAGPGSAPRSTPRARSHSPRSATAAGRARPPTPSASCGRLRGCRRSTAARSRSGWSRRTSRPSSTASPRRRHWPRRAGLDGVEVNAGQHSLLRQFLSGLTNQRGDEWGSDRRCLPARCWRRPGRRRRDRIVGLRLSCDELAPWAGITPEQAPELAASLTDGVDYLVVVRGAIFSAEKTRPDLHEPTGLQPGSVPRGAGRGAGTGGGGAAGLGRRSRTGRVGRGERGRATPSR